MAKKTAKKKPAAAKTEKKAPAKKIEHVEIELDPIETEAFELAHRSNAVRNDLELAVTTAVSQSVRKVFKQHGVTLNASQAQEVALLLFGD